MTSVDAEDPQDAPALVALTELGRDAARPHSTVGARSGAECGPRTPRPRRHAATRAFVAGRCSAPRSAVCARGGRQVRFRRARPRAFAPEPPVSVSRIEGGTAARGRVSVAVGRRGRQGALQRGQHVRAHAGHARAAPLGRRRRRAPRHRGRHRLARGHAEPRASLAGRGGALPGHGQGDGLHRLVGPVERAVRAAACDTVTSSSAARSSTEASRCRLASAWSSACRGRRP